MSVGLVVGKIISWIAMWSDLRESSHDTETGPSCVEIKVGLLASTRSIMDGLELSAFHVGVEGGFIHVMPLSPSQSVR
jgi:hypothetical protein